MKQKIYKILILNFFEDKAELKFDDDHPSFNFDSVIRT